MKKPNFLYDKFMSLFIIIIFLLITQFKCLIKLLTGLPCPACGMTRAYISLLNLDFAAAWNYHPLYWFIPPVILFILFARKPLFNNRKMEIFFFIFISVIIFSVYIYRMIKLFPNTAPMDYKFDSILYNAYRKIKYILQ